MPSSYIDSVPSVMKLVIDVNPTTVCDVGPGWGKYGLMCLEYLPGMEVIDAVEVSAGVKPIQHHIYDSLIVGDVRSVPDDRWDRYDLILIIDVIEHIPFQDGKVLLRKLVDAGCSVIVSTPKQFVEQHDPHNPHEEHLCLWKWTDFEEFGIVTDASTIDSIIYRLGR